MDFDCYLFLPTAFIGRSKKLIAGIWAGFSDTGFDCSNCDEKDKQKRNCGNRKGYLEPLLTTDEWHSIPASRKHVVKWPGLKVFECPLSVVTKTTWDILRIVNGTTDGDGYQIRPFRSVCYEDEPEWYKQAVSIVKTQRSKHREQQMEKAKHGRQK